jgi:hypothetical protein
MKRMLILFTFLLSCTQVNPFHKRILNHSKNSVTILTSSVEGISLELSDARYFSDKLSEYLISDSLQVTERSLVNAFEKAMDLEGREVYSPKELQRLSTNFSTNYYLLSKCRKISEERFEVQINLIDKEFKTKLIYSVKGFLKNLRSELDKAALKIAAYL